MNKILKDDRLMWIVAAKEEDIEDGLRYATDGQREAFLEEIGDFDIRKECIKLDKENTKLKNLIKKKEKYIDTLEDVSLRYTSDLMELRIESVWKHMLRTIKAYKANVTTLLKRGRR